MLQSKDHKKYRIKKSNSKLSKKTKIIEIELQNLENDDVEVSPSEIFTWAVRDTWIVEKIVGTRNSDDFFNLEGGPTPSGVGRHSSDFFLT